jgi:amino acid transporter
VSKEKNMAFRQGRFISPQAQMKPPEPEPPKADIPIAALAQANLDTNELGLPSEHLSKGRFPSLLTAGDLAILATTLILYVTNISVITFAGAAALPYWILGFLTFLIPSAIVTSKLARMFPGEGAFYVWVHKALGPFWDSLLGFFCLWWPPVLLIIAAGAAVAGFLRSIGQSYGQTWLVEPWQQGIVVLVVLAIAWGIARLPLQTSRSLIRGTCYAYLGLLAVMALVAFFWLAFAHNTSQTDFSSNQFALNSDNFTFYSIVILGCLGIQLPLNMAGEVREAGAVTRYLPRSVLLVVGGYLVVWFAMAAILPQDPTSSLSAGDPKNIGQIFAVAMGQSAVGHFISALASLILCAFYVVSSGAYSLVQSRLLVMTSLDRRLPAGLSRVDSQGIPQVANTVQIVILIPIAIGIFFIAPVISSQGADFGTIVYTLISASAVVIWAISALALFLVGAILVLRHQQKAQEVGGAPPLIVLLCGILGFVATGVCIWLVLTGTPWTFLLTSNDWFFWVALLVLGSLAVGAVYSFLAPEPADIWSLLARSNQPRAGRTS